MTKRPFCHLTDLTVFQASHALQGKHSGYRATFIACVSSCRFQAILLGRLLLSRGSLSLRQPSRGRVFTGANARLEIFDRNLTVLGHNSAGIHPIWRTGVCAWCGTSRLKACGNSSIPAWLSGKESLTIRAGGI